MTHKRLSREESRELTRQRLMEAASIVIVQQGLGATSVETITAQAGYTRGAFYSNFKSKADLFFALLKLDHEELQRDLQAILEAGEMGESLQKQLTMFYGDTFRDCNRYLLWSEARLLATRDEEFCEQLTALQMETRDMVAYFIEQFTQRIGIPLAIPAKDLALALMALVDGMQSLSTSMPGRIPDEDVKLTLQTIFSALFFGR